MRYSADFTEASETAPSLQPEERKPDQAPSEPAVNAGQSQRNRQYKGQPPRRSSWFRVSFNAPVTLTFTAVCLLAFGLSLLTGNGSTRLLFSVYSAPWTDPLTYVRLIGHVFGHITMQHMINNLIFILLLGPMLEEKYSSRVIFFVILITAAVSGLIHMLLFPRIVLLGASGVVFAFILLSSFTRRTGDNTLPFTFILVFILYIGSELLNSLFVQDSISHLTHIIGGLVGSAVGLLYHHNIALSSSRRKRADQGSAADEDDNEEADADGDS